MSALAWAWVGLFLIIYFAFGMIYPELATFFLPKKWRTRIAVGVIWVILMIPVIIGSISSDEEWVYIEHTPITQTK